MALKEKQKEKWQKTLIDLKLMDENDCIVDHVMGDYWKIEALRMKKQIRGNFFFTNEKFIFVGGFGLDNLSFNYTDIISAEKCNISLFVRTGIKLEVNENGSLKNYLISVMKRDNWIELLNSKK